MGDIATQAAATFAPANEVPIETNPVAIPNPMSSTAPEAPVGDIKGSEHRPPSRREAIQAAFERAQRPPPPKAKEPSRPAARPAEAKPGHNQPPEPAEPEALNLKKRPDEQAAPAPQPRGDRGQFAPRPRPPAAGAATETAAPAGQPVRELPRDAPFRDPIPRMSDQARADWHATPESVRGDVHRVAQEFTRFYQRTKADVEAMKPIKRFHDMAVAHGTTLERALTSYVGMEQKLRTDLIGGLDTIVNNLRLKTVDGQPITMRDVAYHVLSQTPEQVRLMQQGNQQQAAANQIGALHQQIANLQNTVTQMHNQQRFTQTRAGVDQFADSRPRFDELADLIKQEIDLGFDLDTAYRRAELLRPTTHADQTRNTSAQTRPTTDRSISGAPAGSNGSRPPQKNIGRREAIADAMKRAGAGF